MNLTPELVGTVPTSPTTLHNRVSPSKGPLRGQYYWYQNRVSLGGIIPDQAHMVLSSSTGRPVDRPVILDRNSMELIPSKDEVRTFPMVKEAIGRHLDSMSPLNSWSFSHSEHRKGVPLLVFESPDLTLREFRFDHRLWRKVPRNARMVFMQSSLATVVAFFDGEYRDGSSYWGFIMPYIV